MLIEVVLDLFVGDVNTELLERVHLEVLKTEYVQDADRECLFPAWHRHSRRKAISNNTNK